MRLSNYNIDFISGHVPYYQQKNVAVKTNQFYRDAFVQQMKEGQNLPADMKRQMGLNSIFEDERNFQSQMGHRKKNSKIETRHCSGASNDKGNQEPRFTLSLVQKRQLKASSSQATFRSNKKDSQYEGSDKHSKTHSQQIQKKENAGVDEAEQIKQFLRDEQEKIYFVKPLEQKQNIRYAPLRKFHENSNKQSQVQSQLQSEKVSILIGPEDQEAQPVLMKSDLNLEEHKDKFQNQNINKILSGRLDQENESKSDIKNKFNRISHTSQQSKRQRKTSNQPLSSDRKFLDAEAELKDSQSIPVTKRQYYMEGKELLDEKSHSKIRNQNSNSQDASSNSMINKLIKERQNNQQESYMKDLREGSLTNINQQQFQNQHNFQNMNSQQHQYNFSGSGGSYQANNMQHIPQDPQQQQFLGNYVGRKSENFLIGNLNAVTPSMYRQISKVNEPILSAPVVITKYQINQHFSNSQTIHNHLREKVNSEQRKELLSFFNENRYKFFSNNDLNAEKFFVTRNRERIKDLNFERIGIFKSKQPQTHVKHFRFFINDLKVQEPRFQNPLKTEQEQLEQSFRKASNATHNSKLSSSDLTKESIPNQRDPISIAANLIGERGSKGVLNSPVGGGNYSTFSQTNFNNPSIQNITDKQISPSQMKTPLQSNQNTPSAATAAGTSPYYSSAQSKFQFMSNVSEQGVADLNDDHTSDSKDTANMRKLKQQYLNFVQQNMNPKLQQVRLNNNLIQEEKEESIIEEDQTHKNQKQQKGKKKTKPSMSHIPAYINTNEHIPSTTSITNIPQKKQLKVNINEIDQQLANPAGKSSQTIVVTEHDNKTEKDVLGDIEENSDAYLLFSAKNDALSPITDHQVNPKQYHFKLNLKQENDENGNDDFHKSKKFAQLLVGQDSNEFDNNYMVQMQYDKDSDGEYIYSKQFQDQIKSLEEEQKRLETIENLFFLKLKPKDIHYYNSENFKIHRKKMLLDTILKNKKITTRDKKLIFSNLLYQYNIKSGLHSNEWCKEMTKFLMNNKFKYNLDEAANRKYERAQQKIVQLPTFRDPNGEYYYDFDNFVHQLATPSPLTTEGNEVHFQEYSPDEVQQNQERYQLHIKRFQPKQLSKTYSHFQFQKIKY